MEKPKRKKSKIGLLTYAGIVIVAFWILIVFFGPLLAPHDEGEIISKESFTSIGEIGLLGTDFIGRDVLSRLLFGARMTMGLAFLATLISFSFGSTLGFIAAVSGGWLDNLLSRLNDALMAFPAIMLALLVIASLGTSMPVLIFTIGLVDATRVFRLSRALGRDIGVMDYVDVARARGEGIRWIIFREILPNTIAPLAAELGLRFTGAIMFVSALSFLGLGVQPPYASWGIMVRENMSGLVYGSTAAFIPAIAIASLTVGNNFIVDTLLARANEDAPMEMR